MKPCTCDREKAFGKHAGLELVVDQTLQPAIFPKLGCADHVRLWRDVIVNAVFMTMAPYGRPCLHQDALMPSGLLWWRIPKRLGPYHNDDTTQYLIGLPHAEVAFDECVRRLLD